LGKGRAYNVTHEEEDAEVIGQAQTLDALMNVLWMESMIPQATIPRTRKSTIVEQKKTLRGVGEGTVPEEKDASGSTDLIVG